MGKDLDYTIWFVPVYPTPSDPDHYYLEYAWSLATKTAKNRKSTDAFGVEMYAPLMVGNHQQAFHLLKMKAPVVSEPVRKRDIVEIFGRDGDIDLYDQLLKKPIFERRTIEEQFMLLGQNAESGNYYVSSDREWAGLISQLKIFFNSHTGQMRLVLSHDPGFYWLGRVTAAVDDLGGYRAVIRITADVEPYKYERYHSAEPWIWDDFSFIDGIIREYTNISIVPNAELGSNEYMPFVIPMRLKDVVPEFDASGANVQVSIDAKEWHYVPNSGDFEPVNGIQLSVGFSPYITEKWLYFKKSTYAAASPQTGDNPNQNNWFERSGASSPYVYTRTDDTTVDNSKTYYAQTLISGSQTVSIKMRGATL